MAERPDRRRGKAVGQAVPSRPLQGLAPGARIPCWPRAARLHTRGGEGGGAKPPRGRKAKRVTHRRFPSHGCDSTRPRSASMRTTSSARSRRRSRTCSSARWVKAGDTCNSLVPSGRTTGSPGRGGRCRLHCRLVGFSAGAALPWKAGCACGPRFSVTSPASCREATVQAVSAAVSTAGRGAGGSGGSPNPRNRRAG